MDLQSKIMVSILLIVTIVWILHCFAKHKLGSGQALFWLAALVGAEVLTLSPPLVHWVSGLWGDLWPVSWITFVALLTLIAYLLYQSIKVNQLRSRYVELARSMAFLEQRVRQEESQRAHGS